MAGKLQARFCGQRGHCLQGMTFCLKRAPIHNLSDGVSSDSPPLQPQRDQAVGVGPWRLSLWLCLGAVRRGNQPGRQDKAGRGSRPWEISGAPLDATPGCCPRGPGRADSSLTAPSLHPRSQLGGCGILGVGIWLAATQGNFATLSSSFPSLSAANLLIVTGSLVMAIGFVGCIGAIKEHRCLLLTVSVGGAAGWGAGSTCGSDSRVSRPGWGCVIGWGPPLTGQGHVYTCVPGRAPPTCTGPVFSARPSQLLSQASQPRDPL